MRLISLYLIAYGNFKDRQLVFPEEKGLQVIYGPNEAGKSMCLRALRGLLYGIPESTTDDFLHEGKQLRIGAALLRSDGERLSIVRRKGRRNTLLGLDGQPIAEDRLRSFLGGVDGETFVRVFGMSRDELVSGGCAIMEGKGSVGESLFAAGLGGADLKCLLSALESEAVDLFKPGGTNPKLNSESKAYKELKTRIRELSLAAKDWEELESKVSDLKSQSARLKDQIAQLLARKDRRQRLRDALPAIAELNGCQKKRADLGEVKILREGFSKERVTVQGEKVRALSDEKTAQEKIGEIDTELEEIVVPEDLLTQEKTVQSLVEELGSVLKAQKDLPRVQGQVLEASQAAEGILAELRPDLALESAGSLRLTVERIDRIRGLFDEHGKLMVRRESATERVSEHTIELAEAERKLDVLPEGRDTSELERSIHIVRKRGDLEGAYADADCETQTAREDAEALLERLPLWYGTLEALECLPVPPEVTIDEFEGTFDVLEADLRKSSEALSEVRRKTAEIDSDLQTLKLAGEPPTEENITGARMHRDKGWTLVRSAWLEGKRDKAGEAAFDPSLSLEQAYERSVQIADNAADRMRWEAEKVVRKARLVADRGFQEERIKDLSREMEQFQESRKSLEAEWTSRWAPLGFVPMSAREMRAWMTTWKELVRRAAEIRKLNGQAKRIAEEVEESRKTLLDCFAVLGEQAPPDGSSLEAILLRAEQVVQSEKNLKTERETLKKEIEGAIRKKTNAEEEEKRGGEEFAEWKNNWAAAIKGLSEGLPVSAASTFLDKCAALQKKLDDVEKDKGRIEGMKRDIEEFRRIVAEFVARYAPDLAALPADEAVRGVSARVSKAKSDVASRARLSGERISRKRDLDKAREAISQASQHLASLRQEAGFETDEELSDAEIRSESARCLNERISELTRQLLVLAAGTKIDDFVGKVEQEDPEQIQEELAKIDEDLAEAQDELDRVGPNLGITSERLRAMDGRPDAALAAQEAQAGLASLTNNLERYLRVRLAAKILQTEIERYRERSQGPLLMRAAELFALVTEGRFVSLEPDYGSGDEPVLVGVRESGERVALVGMSDGTQDQLYLALRLASLERFSAGSEPLPLLVDDALVNFDDERARAALKVFGDLTKTTQVIFFTHHRHMKRLAEEAVDDRILHIQDLVET